MNTLVRLQICFRERAEHAEMNDAEHGGTEASHGAVGAHAHQVPEGAEDQGHFEYCPFRGPAERQFRRDFNLDLYSDGLG